MQLYLLCGRRAVCRKKMEGLAGVQKMSVIIPFRNEEANIDFLIESICSQDGAAAIDWVLVNDHSTDDSLEIAERSIKNQSLCRIKLVDLPMGKEGKKAAIREGIANAEGSLLLFSDADIQHPTGWTRSMHRAFDCNPEALMLSGPVTIKGNSQALASFQSIEYGSLMCAAAGSLSRGFPLLASGANLGIRKSVLDHLGADPWKDSLASGDDIFLMQSIYDNYGKGSISFVMDNDALVYAKAERSWKAILKQRIRWAGKTLHQKSCYAQIIGSIAAAANAAFIVASGLCLAGIIAEQEWIFLTAVKFLAEALPAAKWLNWTGQQRALFWLPLMVLAYPFWSLIVFFGIVSGSTEWKDRSIAAR